MITNMQLQPITEKQKDNARKAGTLLYCLNEAIVVYLTTHTLPCVFLAEKYYMITEIVVDKELDNA